mgnify:CR=1 FL=1
MAFSFELKLAISSELYGAISAGPEHRSPGTSRRTVIFSPIFSKGRQHLLHGPPQTGADTQRRDRDMER